MGFGGARLWVAAAAAAAAGWVSVLGSPAAGTGPCPGARLPDAALELSVLELFALELSAFELSADWTVPSLTGAAA